MRYSAPDVSAYSPVRRIRQARAMLVSALAVSDMLDTQLHFINPRRSCAARVTVVVLCLFVCLSTPVQRISFVCVCFGVCIFGVVLFNV